MASTLIRNTSGIALPFNSAGGGGRTIVRTGNGVLWSLSRGSASVPYLDYSTDNGATWTSAPVPFVSTFYSGTLAVDSQDRLYVLYGDTGASQYRLVCGTPTDSTRTAYTFAAPLQIAPTISALGDLVVSTIGGVTTAHVFYHNYSGSYPPYYVPITVASNGTLTAGPTQSVGGTATTDALPGLAVDFQHNGDGLTPVANPSVFFSWQIGTTLYFNRATYSGSAWTVTAANTRTIATGLVSAGPTTGIFDGSRYVMVGVATGAPQVWTRDAADTTTTQLAAPPATAATPSGVGLTYSQASQEPYLFIIDSGTPKQSRLTAGAWSAWSAYSGVTTTASSNALSVRRGSAGSQADSVILTATPDLRFASVSVNSPPNAPTLTSPANNATIDRGIVQRFAWNPSDPDAGDSQSKFDLQYRVVNTTPWTTVSSTTPNTFYDFAASTFAAGNYEWQVRTYDSQGVVGPWCSSSFFTAAVAPPQPTITAPTSGATVQNTATLTWSAPNQTDYQWRRVKDNAGSADTSTIYQDSGDVVDSTTRSVTLTFDTNNRYEHIQVRIKNAGLWSSWADIRVQVSYTPPTVATFTMAADPTTATRTLTVTNPAPGSGVPATSYNDVYVRTAASSTVLDTYRPYSATGTRIGTQLATNTPFVDRTPAGSPVVYEYRVVAVATNQTTADSGWVATT